MKQVFIVTVLIALAACGGRSGGGSRSYAMTASGPISDACLAAGRDAANRGLCGCVQAAANRTLGESDQRRAVGFFRDPQEAQDVKASSSASADAFWDRYRNFVDTAEAMCRA
jgi:hypothetical protein